jgi:Na+-transporting methylmalonyl-CoA/oxaloacetate decarboxylase beta subunit
MEVLNFFQGLYTFFLVTPGEALARVFLIALGLLFLYLGYRRTLEPLLMIPMGIGMLGVNGGVLIFEANNIQTLGTLFVDPLVSNTDLLNAMGINFLQPIYSLTFSNGLIACLVFMGIGAITEIDFLIAKPYLSFFLAAFAELGTILTLPIAWQWV